MRARSFESPAPRPEPHNAYRARWSGLLDHGSPSPSRDADDQDGGWDVTRDYRAGGHDGIVADSDALEDGGTGTIQTLLPTTIGAAVT